MKKIETNQFDEDGIMKREPPIIGNWEKPPEAKDGAPPRKGQFCANCNAFDRDEMGNTICAAHPSTPIFLGMGTTKTLNAQGQTTPVPVVWGFWPPTTENRWCREWAWIGPKGDK